MGTSMTKKRVLHIVSTGSLSGAEKVVSDICTHFNQFEPYCICSGEQLQCYYKSRGLKTTVINISGLSGLLKLRKLVKQQDIALIHGHDVKASIAACIASVTRPIPVISHIHSMYPWLLAKSPHKYIDKIFRNSYSCTIACSKAVRDYYIRHNKSALKHKIIQLTNAFNFREFNEFIPANLDLKTSLGFSGDDFVYGYCGRLIKLKGVDLLIDAFYELSKKYNNAKLVIIGSGQEKNSLQQLVKNYALEYKVLFVGFAPIYEYKNVVDCFVLPSIFEGLPIVLLEAIAMKKVVISSPLEGVAELIKSDDYGIMLKKRTKEDMLAALQHVYMNYEDNKNKTERAYKLLEREYSLENYIPKLENIYKNLLSEI